MKKLRTIKSIGRGGKRRTLGWTLLTLGLLVAGVWVASQWWWVRRIENAPGTLRVLTLAEGRLVLWRFRGDPAARHAYWQGGRNTRNFDTVPLPWYRAIHERKGERRLDPGESVVDLWTIAHETNRAGVLDLTGTITTLNFWPIPLLLWTPTALLLRSGILARRRAITGKCKACGYDLAGLGGGATCPECGKAEA